MRRLAGRAARLAPDAAPARAAAGDAVDLVHAGGDGGGMGRDDQRPAARKLHQAVEHPRLGRGVEMGGRLVEQDRAPGSRR